MLGSEVMLREKKTHTLEKISIVSGFDMNYLCMIVNIEHNFIIII